MRNNNWEFQRGRRFDKNSTPTGVIPRLAAARLIQMLWLQGRYEQYDLCVCANKIYREALPRRLIRSIAEIAVAAAHYS
jgi:hypothetical protein